MRRLGYTACALLILTPVFWLSIRSTPPETPAEPDAPPAFAPPTTEASPTGKSLSQQPLNPPPPAHRGPLDAAARAEGEALLRRMRNHWRLEFEAQERAQAEGRLGCGFVPPGRFAKEAQGGRTELRLFALGYPEIAERWCRQIAPDPRSPKWERWRTIYTLGSLAEARAADVAPLLADLCTDPEEGIRWLAQHCLATADRSGSHRALFRSLAKQGETESVQALANWPDADGLEICRLVRNKWVNQPYPLGGVHYSADAAIERIEAATSGTWENMAQKTILEQSRVFTSCHLWWALRYSQDRQAPWLERVIRQRLKKDGEMGAIEIGTRGGMHSDVADDLLVALIEIGGALTEAEQSYLRRNGYACEPQRRLRDLLDERSYEK
jgi:hypothetical protein